MSETAEMKPGVMIKGEWRHGGGAPFSSTDPASGETVLAAHAADPADVVQAVASARSAFADWSRTSRARRAEVMTAYARALEARGAAIAEAISRDTGKPLWESRTEVAAMVGKIAISLRAYDERTGEREEAAAFGRASLEHRPWGVMAVLGPFNFPGHLPNGHLVPALLAGNTAVFKPSELAPSVAVLMADAFAEAGLPDGVLNIVMGGRETGQALLRAPGVDGVLFTGSAQAGIAIHALFGGRPEVILALEMGGNNPLIVWDPAGIEEAADIIVHSSFITAGQRCSCARRLILPLGRFGDAVLEAVEARIARMAIGAWNADPQPFIGPVIHARQAAHVSEFEADLVSRGGRPIVRATVGEPGPAFVRPGLIDMTGVDGVPDEELFAPFAQVYRATSLDEAVAMANDTRFGLSAGLVCDDAGVWRRALSGLRAGLVNWNRPTTGASSALPFGGPGLSGDGRPSAYYAADYCAFPVARQEADRAERLSAPGLT